MENSSLKNESNDRSENVKKAIEKLANSKPKKEENASTRNIIKSMAPEIKKLIKQGFLVKEIAEAIRAEDQSVSISTLKGYISQIKKSSKKKQTVSKPKKVDNKKSLQQKDDKNSSNTNNNTVEITDKQIENIENPHKGSFIPE